MKSFFIKYYGMILTVPLYLLIIGFRVIVNNVEAFKGIQSIIFPNSVSNMMALNSMLYIANTRLFLFFTITITFLITTYLYFKRRTKIFMLLFLVASFVNTHLFITSIVLFEEVNLTKRNVPNIHEALDLTIVFVFIPLEILTLLLFSCIFDFVKNNSVISNK